MLIDILKMPPALGIPIYRQLPVFVGNEIPNDVSGPFIHWPAAPFYHQRLNIGSYIPRAPNNIHKAVYLSHDEKWIFEAVFAEEGVESVCLYCRFLSAQNVTLAISSKAIEYYRGDDRVLLPINQFVTSNEYDTSNGTRVAILTPINSVEGIVPPVFSEHDLRENIEWALSQGGHGQSPYMMYNPIYQFAPSVFRGLIDGRFFKSPFMEMPGYHPNIQIERDRWFGYQHMLHSVEARGMAFEMNHPAFDDLVLDIMHMGPTDLFVQALMSHASDRILDLWTNRNFQDPYNGVLRGPGFDNNYYNKRLSDAFYKAILVYCRIYNIDSELFIRTKSEYSSVSIVKTVWDEVSITFHDVLHDRYICFYSSFPALALATRSVGVYQ